ncbi:NRAMP family divalent metal transporter [Senegalia massiliensis]|uniref:NRAMP family divalent metal transporter n=1 Tax=Senegalia massiliensis TaxID=1720316 RepID=UPI0010314754|nr:divalent metal cation transporter [Senegalia massiliensis]
MKKKKTLIQKIKAAGPAAVITSAFVGPGTITTATNAGVEFGYALLWAVVFSGVSLFIIMNMASRLATIANKNIIEASLELLPASKMWKILVIGLFAIVMGLTALGFEAGNLIGATSGFSDIFKLPTWLSALIMGLLCIIAIIFTTPKIIETIMKFFVAAMGIIFIITAIIVRPNIQDILKGFIPTVPSGGIVNTIALIGTTIIAVNLVFHSVASSDKWTNEEDLKDSYFDTKLNVSLGVLMTLSLIIVTSSLLYQSGIIVDTPLVFSKSLEPILGNWARIFGSFGLVFAGLSSSIATPYMTGIIYGKLFKWNKENDFRIKIVSVIAVVIGTLFAMFGARPTQIIIFAQATSGFFLPFIAILFVITSNNKTLGKYKNNIFQNVMGMISVVVTFGLGMWTLYNLLF